MKIEKDEELFRLLDDVLRLSFNRHCQRTKLCQSLVEYGDLNLLVAEKVFHEPHICVVLRNRLFQLLVLLLQLLLLQLCIFWPVHG